MDAVLTVYAGTAVDGGAVVGAGGDDAGPVGEGGGVVAGVVVVVAGGTGVVGAVVGVGVGVEEQATRTTRAATMAIRAIHCLAKLFLFIFFLL
jgi:hypothetical protein